MNAMQNRCRTQQATAFCTVGTAVKAQTHLSASAKLFTLITSNVRQYCIIIFIVLCDCLLVASHTNDRKS